MPAPPVRPDSKVSITLSRSGCYGSCPAYRVSIGTEGIVFEGRGYVVAAGRHTDTVDPHAVRELAKKIIAADFYSMNSEYRAGVTDNPTYCLSIDIDDHIKQVVDYVGSWVGMPEVISEFEDEVDALAHTERWIEGTDGLVQALKAEGFDFHSYDAQALLKRAAERPQVTTVHELIESGVPLTPLPPPKGQKEFSLDTVSKIGILTASSDSPEILRELMNAGASKSDQEDKNRALARAAAFGSLKSVRLLIGYGADPNADLRTPDEKKNSDRSAYKMNGPGSILIEAAGSGDPDVVREILKYHPNLEARGFRQETAVFFIGEHNSSDESGKRVECLRVLAKARANLNAKDYDGNTPLHEVYFDGAVEELLKLGANVNARNNDGETPIFTNVDDDSIPVFIAHGADLTIRNNKGQTVFEAAKKQGPQREAALKRATQSLQKR
jgi:ankyrin repeat protein